MARRRLSKRRLALFAGVLLCAAFGARRLAIRFSSPTSSASGDPAPSSGSAGAAHGLGAHARFGPLQHGSRGRDGPRAETTRSDATEAGDDRAEGAFGSVVSRLGRVRPRRLRARPVAAARAVLQRAETGVRAQTVRGTGRAARGCRIARSAGSRRGKADRQPARTERGTQEHPSEKREPALAQTPTRHLHLPRPPRNAPRARPLAGDSRAEFLARAGEQRCSSRQKSSLKMIADDATRLCPTSEKVMNPSATVAVPALPSARDAPGEPPRG